MKKQIFIFMLILLLSSGCSFEVKDKKNNTIKVEEKDVTKENVGDVIPQIEEDPTWPANDFTNNILKFEYGDNKKIHTNDNTGFVLEVSNVLLNDFNLYIKNIRNQGYKLNISEINEDTSKSYTADNGTYQVTLTFLEGNVSLSMIKLELGETAEKVYKR